jgi:phosphoribosylformylglycinamidine synthase
LVDVGAERKTGELVRAAIQAGLLTAVHDVSDGGAIVALAEMALAGDVGAKLPPRDTGQLFGENQGRYVVTTTTTRLIELLKLAGEAGVTARRWGHTGGNEIGNEGAEGWKVSLADLRAAHEGFFPALMQGEL